MGLILLALRLLGKSRGSSRSNSEQSKPKQKDPVFVGLVLFFLWSLISNVSWMWNELDIQPEELINQNILLLNNLVAVFAYRASRNLISRKTILWQIIFSCLVLVLSFVLTGSGLKLEDISGSKVRSMSIGTRTVEQRNLYGGNYRIAGYAEDANYASIILATGILAVIQLKRLAKVWKAGLIAIFAAALGFACSKTILISLALGLVLYIIMKLVGAKKWTKNRLNNVFMAALIALAVFLPKTGALKSLPTISTRYRLWSIAEETFERSPVIGNGVGSARSAINMKYHHDWYVQPHSTYWQILAEFGLMGIVLFAVLGSKSLNNSKLSPVNHFAIMMLLIFGLMCETIQLQIFVVIMYVLPLLDLRKEEEDGK